MTDTTINSNNNNSDNNKLKILLFGSVGDEIDAFLQKLTRLHKSKAGPFDAAFCVGLFNAAALLDKISKKQKEDDNTSITLPMKVFLQDPLQEIKQLVSKKQEEKDDDSYPCLKLAHNFYILRNPQPPFSVSVWSLSICDNKPQLVVAACPSRMRVHSKDTQELEKTIGHVSYTGCDLLLSSEWPQGIESVLVLPKKNTPSSSSESQATLPLSFDVAHVALQARARYHVTPSPNASSSCQSSSLGFVQSPPFAHLRATTNTNINAATANDGTTLHVGRFLALGAMSNIEKKGAPKFVHALGLQPFHSLSYFELQQQRPEGNKLQPCPFTDSTYQRDGGKDKDNKTATAATSASGLSEASARRILAEEQSKFGSGGTALVSQRWQQKRKRPTPGQDGGDGDDDNSVVVDPNNTTLFVHGLHHDVRGILQQQGSRQGDAELLRAFTDITGPDSVLTVRRPVAAGQTSSFCFVEMKTHDQAKMIWQLRELDVQGVPLSIKWATAANKASAGAGTAGGNRKDHHGQADGQRKRTRLTEAEARDSTTIYFQLKTAVPSLSTSSLGPTTAAAVLAGTLSPQQEQELHQQHERFKAIAERLRRWMEETLETALADDDSDVKVTAAEEPALQVQLRLVESTQEEGGATPAAAGQQQHHHHHYRPRNYGFLEFASHAAASMALATLTGNTDGGVVLDDAPGMPTTFMSDSSNSDGADDKDKDNPDSSIVVKSGADADEDKSKSNPEEEADRKNNDVDKNKNNSDDKRHGFLGLRLHWGHTKKDEEKTKRTMIEDAESGFRFERKHFPADGRTDCWFCLASKSCEKHLITSVHDTCYTALPRGGMHPGHVLLIPVQHSSQGVLKNPRVAQEMEELKKALRKHAAQVYDQSDLFVFERAIQTRGGYHAHVQCVPIPSGLGIQLQATMMAQARKIGLPLRELTSDLAVAAVLNNNDDDDEDGNKKNNNSGGYFYAEIPTRGGKQDYKKFLYQENSSTDSSSRVTVPLQFGREVLAAVLRKPELAHWKSCLVDMEKESAMATDFRKSFAEIK